MEAAEGPPPAQAAAQPVLNYAGMPMNGLQFQMMQGLLQAAQLQGASTAHAEQLDGLKAAITGTAAAQPEAKRQKLGEAGEGSGDAGPSAAQHEAALYQAAIDTLGANGGRWAAGRAGSVPCLAWRSRPHSAQRGARCRPTARLLPLLPLPPVQPPCSCWACPRTPSSPS